MSREGGLDIRQDKAPDGYDTKYRDQGNYYPIYHTKNFIHTFNIPPYHTITRKKVLEIVISLLSVVF